jgi:hypothetical protein
MRPRLMTGIRNLRQDPQDPRLPREAVRLVDALYGRWT